MTPGQEEVKKLRDQGLTWKQISELLNISETSARNRYNRITGLDDAVSTFNLEDHVDEIGQVWFKNKNFSVQLKRKHKPQDIEALREAFKSIPAAPKISPPKSVNRDLLSAYPFFDVHFGMRARADISGEDYDIEIATNRMKRAMATALALNPPSYRAVIVNGGDFTHADDDTNSTPRNHHVLDVAGRNYTVLRGAVEALAHTIDMALTKHERVEYLSVPGNHDPKNWLSIMLCLAERYRNNPRVIIETSPVEFSVLTHGQVMIAVNHGHVKSNVKDLVMWFAAEYGDIWGRAKYRTVWTGHNHHLKKHELPGMMAEQFPPFCPRDHHAAAGGYFSQSILQTVTFSLEGEHCRYTVPL